MTSTAPSTKRLESSIPNEAAIRWPTTELLLSTTAGLCALFCLWWRRCGAMSSRSKAEHWRCVARIRGVGARTPAPSRLGDADVGRASQLQHAVEDMDRHVHLGGPALIRMRAQPAPDHPLPSPDRGLGSGPARVPGRSLPDPAAPLGDKLEMAVPLGRCTLSRVARHRG